MRTEEREPWLWALSELENPTLESATADAEASDSPIPDATLEAYRAGRLAEAEARRVERILVGDPASRQRLLELAGLAPTASLRVRRRLLERFAPATGGAARAAAGRWRLRWLAAAAVLVATIGTGWWLLRPQLALPAYEVTLSALAERRGPGEPAAERTAEAYADTTVTITATVVEHAVAGVEVALYRRTGERLERLAADGPIELRRQPGAVRFSAPAAALVGDRPGVYELFVLIAREGDLPASATLATGLDPARTLAAGGRRQVHRLTLRLRADGSARSIDNDSRPDEEIAHAYPNPDHGRADGRSARSARPFRHGRLHRPVGALPHRV